MFAKGAPLPFSTEPRATDPRACTRCGGSAARRPPHDGADVHPDTEAETSPGQQHGHHVTRAQDSRRADNPRRLCFLGPHGQRGLRKGRREEATPDPKSGGAGRPACLGPSHPTLSAERSQAKAQLSRPWGRALCLIGRAVRWLAAPTAHLRPAPTLGDHPAGRAGPGGSEPTGPDPSSARHPASRLGLRAPPSPSSGLQLRGQGAHGQCPLSLAARGSVRSSSCAQGEPSRSCRCGDGRMTPRPVWAEHGDSTSLGE